MDLRFPTELSALVRNAPCREESIGLSGSRVFIYEDMVLKCGPASTKTKQEAGLLTWLSGRLPAPKCLFYSEEDGQSLLLMSRISGQMSCEEEFMSDPERLVSALAEALRLLWSTDISGCPENNGLEGKLAAAASAVEAGNVDVSTAEEGTFGPGGFASPEALLLWLESNRPTDDPVFSHGDLCLPNIMLDSEGRLSGFIDLGDCGVCHRWYDIAVLRRSLIQNYHGKYARKTYEGFHDDMIFHGLGIPKDPELLQYFQLLSELA